VITGFMAQTGDPLGTGSGGSGQKLKAEFSQAHFIRGTLGMARTNDPDSGDSQFFICFAPAAFLDGKYTIFGQVTKGMEFVDEIKKGDPDHNGTVANPDRIVKMQVAADAEKKS
jgi:peptidylprolyl isomerase